MLLGLLYEAKLLGTRPKKLEDNIPPSRRHQLYEKMGVDLDHVIVQIAKNHPQTKEQQRENKLQRLIFYTKTSPTTNRLLIT